MSNIPTKRLIVTPFKAVILGLSLCSAHVYATMIPIAKKSVVTAENKALIEVQVPGASPNTLYAFQVAYAGRGGDCQNDVGFVISAPVGGCVASINIRGKNTAQMTLPPRSQKYQYRVLAYDPQGQNPKNSGWSSWGALFQVTDISPTNNLKVGTKTTFSVVANGGGPKDMAFALTDCVSAGNNGFTCTPNAAGRKEWVVKDQAGGTALAKGIVNITTSDFVYKNYPYEKSPSTHPDYCSPQCVEFVRFNFDFPRIRTYAKEFWTNIPSGYSNFPQGSARPPQPGDILVWSGSLNPKKVLRYCPDTGCGHVAIVKSVNLATGKLVRVDANWLGTCKVVEHTMTVTKDASGKYKIGGDGSAHLLGWQSK